MANIRFYGPLVSAFLLALGGCGETHSGADLAGTESAKSLSSDRLGVNVHRPRGEDARFLFGKAQEVGVGWVRIDIPWEDTEIAKGTYMWDRADEPIREAAARGLKVLASISATPKWANDNRETRVPPNREEDWVDFCGKVARRYNGSTDGIPRVEVFGIWNEPDGNFLQGKDDKSPGENPQLYVDRILKPCARAIHQARPDAKTAGPELASKTDYLKKVLDAGGDSLDIITVHKYSDEPSGVMSHMDRVRSIVEQSSKAKGKPIWLTETGWTTKTSKSCWTKTVDDKVQAERSKGLLSALEGRSWIQKTFFYELRDDDADGACQWGMLRSNGSEKPWYGTLRDYLRPQSSGKPSDNGTTNTAGAPAGTYRSSCKNERVVDGVLRADCKDASGKLKAAKLESYRKCSDILNNKGVLVCKLSGSAPAQPTPAKPQPQPTPAKPQPQPTPAKPQPQPTPAKPQLTVPEQTVPGGSYRQTCKNERIDKGELNADCRDSKGNMHPTTLKNYSNCRDIYNNEGHIACKK